MHHSRSQPRKLLMRFLYLGDVLVRHHDPLAPVLLGTSSGRRSSSPSSVVFNAGLSH
jgi:hypothetical protein